MGPLSQTIIALLAMLTIGVVWVGLEVRRLNASISPLANSSLAQGLASI